MTNDEADVMRRLLHARNGIFSHSQLGWAIDQAEELLAAHVEGQTPTTLEWLVENIEGDGDGDEQDWVFYSDSSPIDLIRCVDCEIESYLWSHPLPCSTRAEVRVLAGLGLLRGKKDKCRSD